MTAQRDRISTYEQAERQLKLLAGIHGALVKDIEGDDFATMLKIVENGGGQEVYPEGSVFNTVKDNYTYPWAVMHHGIDDDGEPYMDVRVIKGIDSLQFDAPEIFYFAENGLSAGTYYVTFSAAYGQTPAGNYQFTLTADVPAGGILVGFNGAYSASAVGTNVTVYDSATATTASQTVAISSGSEGTCLGTLAAGGDANEANLNSIQRVCFGNGNYAQSNIRQYLTSDKAAGSVYSSQHKFDRPPSWAATVPGFLTKLPQDFLDIVCPIDIKTDTNNVFETGYEKSSSYTLHDKFWLPSRFQIFGTKEQADLGETQWNYYKGATDVDRIMRNAGISPVSQWLRAPGVGSANLPRLVNTSGVLNNYYANNAYAVAPACRIRKIKAR